MSIKNEQFISIDTNQALMEEADTLMEEYEQQKIDQLNQRVKELEASNAELLDVLEVAQQFIRNGIQYGYINMPDKDCGDSAIETPAKIEAAIQKARGRDENHH